MICARRYMHPAENCIGCSNAFVTPPLIGLPCKLPVDASCDCKPPAGDCHKLVEAAERKHYSQFHREIEGLRRKIEDNNNEIFTLSNKYNVEISQQYCNLNKVLGDYEKTMFEAMHEECEAVESEEPKCECKCKCRYYGHK